MQATENTDQVVYSHKLISATGIRYLESIISNCYLNMPALMAFSILAFVSKINKLINKQIVNQIKRKLLGYSLSMTSSHSTRYYSVSAPLLVREPDITVRFLSLFCIVYRSVIRVVCNLNCALIKHLCLLLYFQAKMCTK